MVLYIHKVHNNVNVYTHYFAGTFFLDPNFHKSECPTALIALIILFWNGMIYHLFVKTFTSYRL